MSEENGKTSPLEAIKERTTEHHERLESRMEDRFFDSEEAPDRQFRALLERLYGLYAPQESVLIPAVRRYLDGYSYDPRRDRLKADLRTLGYDDEDLEALPRVSKDAVVEPGNGFETCGCLYVIEGAELGGSVLRRHFEKTLREETLKADAYYRDRPDETRERWTAFRDRFNEQIRSDSELQSAIRMAQQTFALYERWMT